MDNKGGGFELGVFGVFFDFVGCVEYENFICNCSLEFVERWLGIVIVFVWLVCFLVLKDVGGKYIEF